MPQYSQRPNESTRLKRWQLTETNGAYLVANSLFFGVQSGQSPIINIINFTATKLSTVSGKNAITITFSSDINLQQWEVRADGNGVGSGDLIASGGSISANVEYTVYGNQLTWGDRNYRINIYGQSIEGVWNTYE